MTAPTAVKALSLVFTSDTNTRELISRWKRPDTSISTSASISASTSARTTILRFLVLALIRAHICVMLVSSWDEFLILALVHASPVKTGLSGIIPKVLHPYVLECFSRLKVIILHQLVLERFLLGVDLTCFLKIRIVCLLFYFCFLILFQQLVESLDLKLCEKGFQEIVSALSRFSFCRWMPRRHFAMQSVGNEWTLQRSSLRRIHEKTLQSNVWILW